METTVTENQKNLSALIHISTFSKYFFPFANFFVPLLLWSFNKEKEFVDVHGRAAINFQLSILLYTIAIGLICMPFVLIFAFDFITLIDSLDRASAIITMHDLSNLTGFMVLLGIAALLLFGLFILDLYGVISATIHAGKGAYYKYPLCIPFIKTTIDKQPTHEHTS